MVDQPCMTFVIPTFNRPEMLQQAVASCLGQTVAAEVIVVDHGSSEETQRVCEHFPPQVTVVRRKKDSGPIFAWLDGVLHASTDFINLHFDDDLKNPRFAEECMKLMRDGVGMVLTQARIVDPAGEPTASALFRNWFSDSGVYPSKDFAQFFSSTLVSPCAVVYRRQHLVDSLYVGRLPNQEFDYHGVGPDLHLQLLARLNFPSIGYVAEELAYFRSHLGSITINANSSGRGADLARAYDEARLGILDIQVARFLRLIGFQKSILFTLSASAHRRKRFRKFVRRYAVTLHHTLSRLTGKRRSQS